MTGVPGIDFNLTLEFVELLKYGAMMKIHFVKGDGGREYNKTVEALFQLNGNQRVVAAGLPSAMSNWGVPEGAVVHARISEGEGATVWNLQTCSAVLYCYLNEGKLSDVVAFHAPSGSRNIKLGDRKGTLFGSPKLEAETYNIKFDAWKVVIANGPQTSNYSGSLQERVSRVIKEGLVDIFEITGDGDDIFMYECTSGMFGVNGQGHLGEPGGAKPKVALELEDGGKQEKNDRCCYLTTATTLALGKPDNCPELMTLRWFRDHVLAARPGGYDDILQYYQSAPVIVQCINAAADHAAVYQNLYLTAIAPSITAIQAGQYERAYGIYRAMVERLAQQYLPK